MRFGSSSHGRVIRTTALLNGLDRVEKGTDHALILDLYAEKDPHYDEGRPGAEAYGDEEEFDKTPWLFCMLNNFGGRLGLHGHLDNLAIIFRKYLMRRNISRESESLLRRV